MSYCLTLTLRASDAQRRGVVVVDVYAAALSALRLPADAVFTTHKELDPAICDDRIERYAAAHARLETYASAALVVTQRLHAALVAAALGTPALFVRTGAIAPGGDPTRRLAGLDAFFHVVEAGDAAAFDTTRPPANPNAAMREAARYRLLTAARCASPAVADAAVTFGAVREEDDDDIFYEKDDEGCHPPGASIAIAAAVDPAFFAGQLPTFLAALAGSNGVDALALYILACGLPAAQRCLLRVLVRATLPLAALSVVRADGALRALPWDVSATHVSVATQARLFLASLLPCVDRVLWLDVDTVILRPLAPLWRMGAALDAHDGCGVAARTAPTRDYVRGYLPNEGPWATTSFNAGVALLSLTRFRSDDFEARYAQPMASRGLNDQVVLNAYCNGTHVDLAPSWNVLQISEPRDGTLDAPPSTWGILHFNGHVKPWDPTWRAARADVSSPFARLHTIWNDHYISWDDVFERDWARASTSKVPAPVAGPAGASGCALVLRGISSPREYERFDGRKARSAGWRATYSELKAWYIDPLGADVVLHTWTGPEADEVIAAYAPAAHSVEPARNFGAAYAALIVRGVCDPSVISTGQRCTRVLQNKFSAFWSLREAVRLLGEQEAARGAPYAFVLNTRFDVRLRFDDGRPGGPLAVDAGEVRRSGDRAFVAWKQPSMADHSRPFLDDKLFAGSGAVSRRAGAAFDALPSFAAAGEEGFMFSNHVNLERALGVTAATPEASPLCAALRRADTGACIIVDLYRDDDAATGQHPTGVTD